MLILLAVAWAAIVLGIVTLCVGAARADRELRKRAARSSVLQVRWSSESRSAYSPSLPAAVIGSSCAASGRRSPAMMWRTSRRRAHTGLK
jgi:hypothetical protein